MKKRRNAASAASRKSKKQAAEELSAESGSKPEAMNSALLKKCEEIRKLQNSGEISYSQKRYAIGKICVEIMDSSDYGDHAAQSLAEALGWQERNVRYHADVARAWPDESAFKKQAEKVGKANRTLTWSHFVVIAQEPDGRKRQGWLSRARNEGWSVATLQSQLKTDSPAAGPATQANVIQLCRLLTSFGQRIEKVSSELSSMASKVRLDSLGDNPAAKLTAARQSLAAGYNAAKAQLDRLDKALKSRKKPRARPEETEEEELEGAASAAA